MTGQGGTLSHYLRLALERAGVTLNHDMAVEIESLGRTVNELETRVRDQGRELAAQTLALSDVQTLVAPLPDGPPLDQITGLKAVAVLYDRKIAALEQRIEQLEETVTRPDWKERR